MPELLIRCPVAEQDTPLRLRISLSRDRPVLASFAVPGSGQGCGVVMLPACYPILQCYRTTRRAATRVACPLSHNTPPQSLLL